MNLGLQHVISQPPPGTHEAVAFWQYLEVVAAADEHVFSSILAQLPKGGAACLRGVNRATRRAVNRTVTRVICGRSAVCNDKELATVFPGANALVVSLGRLLGRRKLPNRLHPQDVPYPGWKDTVSQHEAGPHDRRGAMQRCTVPVQVRVLLAVTLSPTARMHTLDAACARTHMHPHDRRHRQTGASATAAHCATCCSHALLSCCLAPGAAAQAFRAPLWSRSSASSPIPPPPPSSMR
jgi:hypothetical protein